MSVFHFSKQVILSPTFWQILDCSTDPDERLELTTREATHVLQVVDLDLFDDGSIDMSGLRVLARCRDDQGTYFSLQVVIDQDSRRVAWLRQLDPSEVPQGLSFPRPLEPSSSR